jgi:hypothetical protein
MEELKMEKGVNLQIQELRNKVATDIGESHIPVSIVRMVMESLLNEIIIGEQQQIMQEKKAWDASQKDVKESK